MQNPPDHRHRALLVSFSGLDGSGKSTQISSLLSQLHLVGLATQQLAFWDDVVVATRYREDFVHKMYGSEKGIGAPGKPVERKDKNIRRWYLTLARHALYLADAVHLRHVIARAAGSGAHVILIDRYIYDELANLPLSNPLSRGFARLVAKFVPQPDIAYLLDADPEAARSRKPEYPVDFMHQCRKNYFRLASLLGNIRTIPPLPLDDARIEVVRAFMECVPARQMLLNATRRNAAANTSAA